MIRKIVIVLVILASLAAVWHWRWTHSPRYALRQAARAAEQHDLTTFRKFVHTEELTARFVDDLLATITEQAKNEPLGGIATGMAMMMRPQLVRATQDALERGIETGSFEPKESPVGNPAREASGYWQQATETRSGFRRVAYIKKDDAVALAGLEMYDAELQLPFVVELKLRDLGPHWQVVEVTNLPAVQKQLEEATRKKLDAMNEPIREELRKAVVVEGGMLRNVSGKTITEVELADGEIHKDGIPPNATIEAGADVRRVKFADGTSIQLLTAVPR